MDKEKILQLLDKIPLSEKDQINILVQDIKKELDIPTKSFSNENEFKKLQDLLNSEAWPEAVMEFQICDENSEEEKMDRAEGIVDILINQSLKDKRFLDFGCGEGHMAKYASAQGTVLSIGYDIVKSNNSKFKWEEKQENFLLTTDLEKVKSVGPYDAILIYDVLDHAQDPVQILKDAKSLLAENGTVYLRCHPWCGRHGSHLYRQINKAFIHLIFTDEELINMGYQADFNKKVFYPIGTYKKYIEDAGFAKKEPDVDTQDIEEFFRKNDLIKNRILRNFKTSKWTKGEPEWQMSQCFLDFILDK